MGLGVIVKSFLILVIHVASMIFGNDITAINERCDQTPHPSQCKTLLIQNSTEKPITSTTEFLKVFVERTLDGAVIAKSKTYSLGSQFDSNQRKKEAWEDCMDMYDQTIYRLNQSVTCAKNECSGSDVQSWLSTALTNLDTCREGMLELGVSSDSMQSMLQSITIDVINALAINKEIQKNENKYGISKAIAMETPSNQSVKVDVVVAQDGSGKYKTIQEAVNGAGERPKGSLSYVIHVKEGVYEEYVKVGKKSNNIMIIGEGIGKTIITGDRSNSTGFRTFKSATFEARGDGFVARNITIRNTAPPENHQAVALLSASEKSAFYNCSIEGYQDTLYVYSGRHFFRECDIYGTVDFIFGKAGVVLQNCRIFTRRPPNGVNTITAQKRLNVNQTSGIVIQNSIVTIAPGVQLRGVKTYLGRPWSANALTVVMGTHLGALIEPKGWIEWVGKETDHSSLYYGEYKNWGPGSGIKNRVDWPGFHVISDIREAQNFTVRKFISGASWLPQTRVPFYLDFL